MEPLQPVRYIATLTWLVILLWFSVDLVLHASSLTTMFVDGCVMLLALQQLMEWIWEA